MVFEESERRYIIGLVRTNIRHEERRHQRQLKLRAQGELPPLEGNDAMEWKISQAKRVLEELTSQKTAADLTEEDFSYLTRIARRDLQLLRKQINTSRVSLRTLEMARP